MRCLQLQYHDRDDNGDDTITEGFQSGGFHVSWFVNGGAA